MELGNALSGARILPRPAAILSGMRILTASLVALFFLGFAAVDFYFPRAMKKKWLDEQARVRASQAPQDKP